MPRVEISEDEQNLANGAEDNENDQEGEGEDKGKEKEQPREDRSAEQTQAAVNQLTRVVQGLSESLKGQGTQQQQQQVSEIESALQDLLDEGYKPDQLKAVTRLAVALRAQVTRELKAEYAKAEEEKATKTATQSLDRQCFDRASEVLDKVLDGKSVSDRQRQIYVAAIQDEMEQHRDLKSARDAYASGRVPSLKDFEKAANLVLQNFGKAPAMNTRDNTNSQQLDVKNSRINTSHPAISKNGDVDLSKLNEDERFFYTTTLNALSNKESKEAKAIALKALRDFGNRQR